MELEDLENIYRIGIVLLFIIWLFTVIVIMKGENIGIVKLILIFIPAFTFMYFLWHSKKFFLLIFKAIERLLTWLLTPIIFLLKPLIHFFVLKPMKFMFFWLWR
jgi:hypothetical protein